ncbi:hypothetical protein KHP62_04700 [Rhodobacteraceae bacterium NNCM2]|nr:hypothetical protein [Coraliihabitans acroporae]
MFLRRKMAIIFAMIAAGLPLSANQAVSEESDVIVASNGALVPIPDIDTLDCAEMAKVIMRIDASEYRDPVAEGPGPDHPDRVIFEYENSLTSREYFECTLGKSQYVDPSLAFIKK